MARGREKQLLSFNIEDKSLLITFAGNYGISQILSYMHKQDEESKIAILGVGAIESKMTQQSGQWKVSKSIVMVLNTDTRLFTLDMINMWVKEFKRHLGDLLEVAARACKKSE